MPELTIGRMARLYGLHRSSLYEAVAKGRVSAGLDSKGQRVIDFSEMLRIYGEPPGKPDTVPTPARQGDPTPDSAPDTYRDLIEELRALRHEVSELRRQMLRLPAPDNTPAPESPEDDPHGFKATVAKLRRQ